MVKPDIVTKFESEGFELKPRGGDFWTNCCFHADKTPSLKIDTDRQRFHCFSCGASGDVISFIQMLKGYSFREALGYLGISPDKRHPKNSLERTKADLVRSFRTWCKEYHRDIEDLDFLIDRVKKRLVKNEDGLNLIGDLYHDQSEWQYRMMILEGRDDQDKFNLYREVTNGS